MVLKEGQTKLQMKGQTTVRHSTQMGLPIREVCQLIPVAEQQKLEGRAKALTLLKPTSNWRVWEAGWGPTFIILHFICEQAACTLVD